MHCSLPGPSVHGFLQARILEWVATSFSRRSSQPKERTRISCIGRRILLPLSHQGSLMGVFTPWQSANLQISILFLLQRVNLPIHLHISLKVKSRLSDKCVSSVYKRVHLQLMTVLRKLQYSIAQRDDKTNSVLDIIR